MALILCLETATSLCSVALSLDGQIIIYLENFKRNSHASLVTKYVKDILNGCEYDFNDLDAIAVGGGPGSYTGIRIGMSIAKGLCYGLDIPLIKVGTLRAMANGAKKELEKETDLQNAIFLPMLDARRKEIFTACYDSNLNELEQPHPEIIDGEELAFARFKGKTIFYFGDGADKCEEYMAHHEKTKLKIESSARNFEGLAESLYKKNETENLALVNASYFKNFYTK